MIFCQLVYRFPILLDAATAAVQRKGDKFLLNWAEIMTGRIWEELISNVSTARLILGDLGGKVSLNWV